MNTATTDLTSKRKFTDSESDDDNNVGTYEANIDLLLNFPTDPLDKKRKIEMQSSSEPPAASKQHRHEVKRTPNYTDTKVLNPEGELMCKIDRKRFDWYIRKGLATQIDETTIQLKFQPKGKGHIGDDFYLSEQINRCVVCGSEREYTRHHVIPHEYRRHFPEDMKSFHSHDIVLLCVECHEVYETEAMKVKKSLAAQYGVPCSGLGKVYNAVAAKIKSTAGALLKHRHKIPASRIAELETELRTLMNKPADAILSHEELLSTQNLETITISEDAISHGLGIVQRIAGDGNGTPVDVEKLEEFSRMWRNHFVAIMNPRFLNPFWDPNRPLRVSANSSAQQQQ